MGQKVNPHGLRVGVIKDWDSRWYARNEKVGDLLVEDKKIRDYLKKTLYSAGIPKIEIERDNAKVRIYLHCARPGVVIGKGGEEIKAIEAKLVKMIGKPVDLKIVEVRNADMNAQLVAENIAQQLEKRIGFRRAMKNAMGRAMRAGARGIKTCCSGRLGGAEIARTEHYHDGTIPLQTLRADIDYGFAEAATTYGRIGVKVWIYKGEVLTQALRTTPRTLDTSKPYQERRDRPRRDRRHDPVHDHGRHGGDAAVHQPQQIHAQQARGHHIAHRDRHRQQQVVVLGQVQARIRAEHAPERAEQHRDQPHDEIVQPAHARRRHRRADADGQQREHPAEEAHHQQCIQRDVGDRRTPGAHFVLFRVVEIVAEDLRHLFFQKRFQHDASSSSRNTSSRLSSPLTSSIVPERMSRPLRMMATLSQSFSATSST